MALIVEKEECLVAPLVDARDVHRAAQRNAELVAVCICFRLVVNRVEVIVGIERTIAQVIVRIPMEAA